MNAESMVIITITIIIAIADAADAEYATSLVVCAAEGADADIVNAVLLTHVFGSEAADNIISVCKGGFYTRLYIFIYFLYIVYIFA